jgi:single-strand DNA-binding protein
MNRVILFGNLCADPELKMSGGGMAVLKLRMATNDRRKNGDQWEEVAEYHNVTVFGKRAEGLGSFLTKGTSVLVEGKLRTSSYEDRDGNKRTKTEVVADDVKVTSKKGDRAQSRPAPIEDEGALSTPINGDDIPF